MLTVEQCEILSRSPLFFGIEPEKVQSFLEASGAYPRKLVEDARIIGQGETQTEIWVVLSGAAKGEKLTADGRAVTINTFMPGDVFGDVLSGASERSPVSVRMTSAGEMIGIPFSALMSGSGNFFDVRERVLRNIINETGKKYFALLKRVNLLTAPTLRGKIAIYLLDESNNTKNTFEISHSREEQARLLDCDRSALSRELSRMKKEGMIDFHGKQFEILDREGLRNIAQ